MINPILPHFLSATSKKTVPNKLQCVLLIELTLGQKILNAKGFAKKDVWSKQFALHSMHRDYYVTDYLGKDYNKKLTLLITGWFDFKNLVIV